MKETILTISMLVSGREETTEKSLIFLQPLREQLGAELILTDTGCRPEYIEKIRKYADRILEFTWCNDFAKARNAGLEVANGQWFMFIDDDEWFEDVSPIIQFFQSGEYKDYHQAVYIARNYNNFEGTSYTDDWVSRMIRVEEDTCFEGSVHEFLTPARGKCKRIEAFVHHYGYVFATDEEREAHFERNVSILEDLLKKEPNNLKWPLQLLKEYHSVGRYERMKEIAVEAIQFISNVDEPFKNMCRGSFYLAVLEAECRADAFDKMWQSYETFVQNEKNPWNVRCALAAFMLLRVPEEYEEKLQDCAIAYVEAATSWEKESCTEQEQIIAESIVFVSEYMHRISAFAQAIESSMEGNAEFLFQPSRAWMFARLGLIPLEEMLLSLPVSQWMAQMRLLQMQGYNEKWNYISMQLGSICTTNNIRYSYFDMVLEIVKMKQIYSAKGNADKMNLETMTQIMTEFAQANLNYMDYLYTEAVFEGDMELLTQEEKASMWIANGLSMGTAQWREKLQCFSEAAKICPMLSEFIKRYIKLFGETLMR